jgi:hypothetical protein
MCGPWALPFLATGLGGGLQYLGAKKAENAQSRAFEAERVRQRQFTEEQQGLYEDSLARAAAMRGEDAQAAAVERRAAPLRAAIEAPGAADYLPGSSGAAPIVRVATDRANTGQRADSNRLATAMARMAGFGDQLFDTSIMNSRNAGKIGQTASFMGGSAAASEAEIRAAAHKGAGLRGLGQLVQQVGMALATGGMGGKPGVDVMSSAGMDTAARGWASGLPAPSGGSAASLSAMLASLYNRPNPDWRAAY